MPHIWRQAFLGAIHSFQRSLVVKHTDTAWLFPTFIAFQVVVVSPRLLYGKTERVSGK